MKIRLSPLALFLAGVVLFSPAVAGAGEIVTGLGAGGGPVVSAFDAATLSQLSSFFAYSLGFTGGVRVAVGDVNGDGVPDILTGTGPGGPAHVKVFDAVSGAEVRSFFAYAPAFGGGVRVAAGDISGDGTADIITGAGPAGATHIKVFDGVTNAEIRSFFAYSPSFTGGVFVGSGDVNNDGRDDIVTGADAGGGPHVKVFDGVTGAEIRSFFAGSPSFTGGIRVAAGDVNGDGFADIVTGAGPGGAAQAAIYDGASGALLGSFLAAQSFTGGVYVAATAFTPPDTTPPVVSVPSSISVDATSPDGAVVTFEATATDPDDAAGPVTCVPASGSVFPIGATTVTCESTDTHGNTGQASFVVTVRSPAQSLVELIAKVGGSFPQSANLLQNARRSVSAGQTTAGCNMLVAFINQVNAQAGKSLDVGQAGEFTIIATQIRSGLACP